MTKLREHSTMATHLQVPDAETLDVFQKNAKQIWLKAHPDKNKKYGRPSHEAKIFDVLWIAEANEEISDNPTQGELVRLVQNHLGIDRKTKKAEETEKAIRKYSRIWLIVNRKSSNEVTDSDYRFILKHYPKMAIAFNRMVATMKRYWIRKPIDEGRKDEDGSVLVVSGEIKVEGLPKLMEYQAKLGNELKRFYPSEKAVKSDKRLKQFNSTVKFPFRVPLERIVGKINLPKNKHSQGDGYLEIRIPTSP